MHFYIPKFKTLAIAIAYLSIQGCTAVGMVLDAKLDDHANKHSQKQNGEINNIDDDVAPFTSLGLKADAHIINQLVKKTKSAIKKPQTPEQLCRKFEGKKRERCLNEILMHSDSNQVLKVEIIDSQ